MVGAGRPPAAPAVAGGGTGAALGGEASVGRGAGAVARRTPVHSCELGARTGDRDAVWVCDAGAVARRAPVGAWRVRLGVMRARLRAARRLVRDG